MINSTSNKQIKRVVNLRSKSKARREEGVYVAEGLRMCREFSPREVEVLYVTEDFAASRENRKWMEDFRWEMVTDIVMNFMADTKTPQGVLAVAKQRSHTLDSLLSGKGPACLMILETLQDPGNLGTILRAGEGAGITGIVMNRECADIYSPKVIRSTMGSILRVPFVYADDFQPAIRKIKESGIRLFAAHLEGANNYDKEDYTGNVGFIIGNEGSGLTAETAALADARVKIPMAGKVESLNAAIASSILMFETARQRRR